MMDVLQKFEEFIENVSSKDKIALFFDPDPDGISAGVLVNKAISKLRGRGLDLILFQEHGDLEIKRENIDKLRENKINKVFMVDLVVDEFPEPIFKISEFANLCILDHHTIYLNMNSDEILQIKPQMFDKGKPVSYVSAKLVYDLFSKYVDLSDYDWIAAIGVMGDAALKRWADFIKQVCQKYNLDLNNLFSSKLAGTMRLIASAPEFGFNVIQESFDVLNNAKSFDDVLNSSLLKYRKIINKEMNKFLKDFNENAERIEDLVFYEFSSKYTIGSTLSTRVSFREPNKTFIVLQDSGDGWIKISLRRQDTKVKVNELVSEAVKGLSEASGGGHIPAAGGRIKKRDLDLFKEKIMQLLGKI